MLISLKTKPKPTYKAASKLVKRQADFYNRHTMKCNKMRSVYVLY